MSLSKLQFTQAKTFFPVAVMALKSRQRPLPSMLNEHEISAIPKQKEVLSGHSIQQTALSEK